MFIVLATCVQVTVCVEGFDNMHVIRTLYNIFDDFTDLDPLTSSQDETVNVQRGHGIKIHLPSFKSYPFPPTVEWHRNSNIMADEGPNHQVTLSKDLVLLDTQTGDDGHVYQAEILNGLNGETSTTKTYTIKVSGGGFWSLVSWFYCMQFCKQDILVASENILGQGFLFKCCSNCIKLG